MPLIPILHSPHLNGPVPGFIVEGAGAHGVLSSFLNINDVYPGIRIFETGARSGQARDDWI